jgi:HlyD family secretion protein
MSTIALPTSVPARRWQTMLAVFSLTGVLAVAGWLFLPGAGASTGPMLADTSWFRIVPMDLDIKVVKDGELQAINNIEISCLVEGQTTIQELVREGAFVKKGDVLVVLDSASIRQKIEDTTLDLQKAEADVVNSRELKDIQVSKNAADLEAGQVSLMLAQLAYQKYTEGTYPQQLADARTDLRMAEITLKNKQEELEQTRKLFDRGFVNASNVKDAELEVTKATNSVNKATNALNVLTKYSNASDLAEKKNAVSQAEQRLARVRRENASSLSQRQADVRAKEQSLAVLKRRMDRLEEQLAACTITAPADGMVVYASDRNSQTPMQEGTQVRERQTILRLPDTSTMKAVLRIQESQVARLKPGQRAEVEVVGYPDRLRARLAKISVLADSSNRWWNPDLREYPVDLVLDRTPGELKPGMGVMAEIFVERLKNVAAVPLASIYSAGEETFIFVRQAGKVVPRKVEVGQNTATHAHIVSGARPGEDVLILQAGQGRELLAQAGIEVKDPNANGSPDEEETAGADSSTATASAE